MAGLLCFACGRHAVQVLPPWGAQHCSACGFCWAPWREPATVVPAALRQRQTPDSGRGWKPLRVAVSEHLARGPRRPL